MLAFPDDGQIRFRKIRDAGSVLNATFEVIKRNAREAVGGYLAIVTPVAVASAVASLLWVRQMGTAFSDPEALMADPFAIFGSSYLFSILFSLLAFVVAQAATGGYVRLYRRGQAGQISPGALWDETRGLILPVLGLSLAAFLAAVLSGLVNLIPCLGSIAWIALVVWAWPVVSVALVSRVVEADSVSEAWTRARSLVKGSWGFAFGSLFLAWFIAGGLGFVVGLVGAAMGGLAGVGFGVAPDLSQGVPVWTGIVQVASNVLTMAFYLIPFVAAFFVHGRLAEELDGSTLNDDLDTLAEAGFDLPAPPRSTPPASRGTGETTGGGNGEDPTGFPSIRDSTGEGPAGGGAAGGGATGGSAAGEDPADDAGGFRGGGFGA